METPEILTGSYILQVFIGLVIVIVALYASLFFIRKTQKIQLPSTGGIKVHASLQMGSKAKLLVVEVLGKCMILGVNADNVTALYVYDEVPDVSSLATHSRSFGQIFQTILNREAS